MQAIFKFFVENWRFSVILTVMLAISGIFGLFSLQREAFPPVNFARVQVTTIYPGASPEEVEERVTNIIEDELRGIEGVKDVRSTSQSERSEIDIRVDIDRDDADEIVNDIQRAVQRASGQLPTDVLDAPRVLEINAREIPVVEAALIGPNTGRARDLLADALKRRLEDVKGVSAARLAGYTEKELQILLDPVKMERNYVGISEVMQAVAANMKNIPAGYLRDRDNLQLVRVIGQAQNAAQLGDIVVRTNLDGQVIRIRDLGRAMDGAEEPTVLGRFNGQAATFIVATKKADIDALTVVEGIQKEIKSFTAGLPPGYELKVYNDEGVRVQNRLDIVSNNALSGMAIVLIILFLFLPGVIGLLSSFSLPICTFGTVALMVYWGATFNIITMLALIICLGNLVDNSVVVSEQYSRLREEGVPAQEAAVRSAQQFWVPFTASTVTIIAAFLPMLVTKGVLGQFIQWIPVVVTAALIVSLIESLTLLPARLQFASPRMKKDQDGKSSGSWFDRIEKSFSRFVDKALRFKVLTFILLSLLLVSGFVVTAKFNRFELFPAEGVEYYVARFEAPVGTNIQRNDAIAGELSRSIESALGSDILRGIVVRTGIQQVGAGDAQAKNGENVGFALIAIKPEFAPDLSIVDTLAKLRAIPKPPGLSVLTIENLRPGPPVGKPLTVTLRSSDYQQLRDFTTAVMAEARSIDGVFDVTSDEKTSGKEYVLKPKPIEVSYTNLNVDSIGTALRTALQGFTAAKITEKSSEIDVLIRYDAENRQAIDDLKSAKVLNPRGKLVPLAAVSEITEVDGPLIRKHYEFKRAITITAEVDVTRITSAQLNQKIRAFYRDNESKFPAVSPIFGGEEESTNESLASLGFALVLALIGIFATLVFTFRSFTKPLLILSSIPLGLIGVFYAFAIDQRPLSFIAFIGVVGLTGVVINSAIILVDYIEELRRDLGERESLRAILVLASGRRLRAVLATGLTTVVGLIPAAFGLGGYDPILVPITLALSWGMIIGTVLALIWIPVGYLVLEDIRTFILRILRLTARSSAS